MAFGREVDYGLRPVLFQNLRNRLDIADVRTEKGIAWITGKFRKVLQISCVGQAVDINNEICCGAHPVMDEVCPYKSSPPSNQHHEPAPTESDLNRPANRPLPSCSQRAIFQSRGWSAPASTLLIVAPFDLSAHFNGYAAFHSKASKPR